MKLKKGMKFVALDNMFDVLIVSSIDKNLKTVISGNEVFGYEEIDWEATERLNMIEIDLDSCIGASNTKYNLEFVKPDDEENMLIQIIDIVTDTGVIRIDVVMNSKKKIGKIIKLYGFKIKE